MKRTAIVILCSLALGACSSAEDRARDTLQSKLSIKDELELHEVTAYPGDVLCGSYSATTSFLEGRKENALFIITAGGLIPNPGSKDWNIYCQTDAEAALLSETGIGPFTDHEDAILKITADLRSISLALYAYYEDNFEFPTTDQGLDSLIRPPETLRRRQNYREGGYMSDIPKDPWGRPYVYEHERWAGTRGRFSIASLGQAGMPGGEGADADVSYDELPYLEHVAKALGLK